jgi:uncharacterized membrane protein YccC
MLSDSTTLVSAVSAAAAIAGVLAYVYGLRRADQTSARDEALALAETRRQMVEELGRRLAALEHGQRQARAAYKRRVRELEESLEQTRREARDQAYHVQRVYVIGLEESVTRIRDELDKMPPDVEGALAKIEELLADHELRSSAN